MSDDVTIILKNKSVPVFAFATFSTKFLKEGSYLDLRTTTTTHNVWPMTKVGIKEYPLVEYLAGQLMLSDEDRLNALKEYFPNAKAEDWRLWQAGQRVQIIKRDEAAGGTGQGSRYRLTIFIKVVSVWAVGKGGGFIYKGLQGRLSG
jgi:malate dehydrogenase (quinone)